MNLIIYIIFFVNKLNETLRISNMNKRIITMKFIRRHICLNSHFIIETDSHPIIYPEKDLHFIIYNYRIMIKRERTTQNFQNKAKVSKLNASVNE